MSASSAVQPRPAGTMSMQSTGQGATHRSQPVHQSASTVCMRLLAPTMASTGQAWMQSVQPMQCASSMRATSSGPGWPRVRSSGRMGCSSSTASAAMPSSPPGGQRLMGLRRRRWRRRRAGSRHGRTWCIASAAIARRCGRRAGTGHGDSVENKRPRGPRGLTVRLEGGGDEDSASSGPRAIAAGAAPQADCRMNSAILGQIISRQRRPEKIP